LAPKAGKELRGELKGKADDAQALLEKTVERAKELKMEADRQLSGARLRVRRIFGGAKERRERSPQYTESEIGGDA
jgi:gas vesicle protein